MDVAVSVKAGRKLTIWMPDTLVRQIKARASAEDRPASRVVEDAVVLYLRQRECEQDTGTVCHAG